MSANKIYQQIPKVMADVGAIGKHGVNDFDKYNFRSIDDVYNKLQPALQKNGVFFVPVVIESKEDFFESKNGTKQVRVKLKVKYNVFADDGSMIETIVEGEAIDRGDKATNKALTAAFKYLLIQIFCIAVEGMDDADKSSPDLTGTEVPKDNGNAKKEGSALADKKVVIGLMKSFSQIGITTADVLSYIGVPSTDKLTEKDVSNLKNVGFQISKKGAKKEDFFNKGQKQ